MHSIQARTLLKMDQQQTIVESTFDVVIRDNTHVLRVSEFEPLRVENTKGNIIRRLLQYSDVKPIGEPFTGFRSADDVQLYQTVRDEHVIVIGFGEKQPTLFVLTLEGVFPLAEDGGAPYVPAKSYQLLTYEVLKTDTKRSYPQLEYAWVEGIRPHDRMYGRIHRDGLPDEIELSGVLKPLARETGFISADFLVSNGFFVRQPVVDTLKQFDLSNTTIHNAVAYRNRQPQGIYYVYITPTDLIDYEYSLFTISSHEPQFLTLENTEAYHTKMTELVQTRSDGVLRPYIIQLKGCPDLFKLHRSRDMYFSAELLNAFQAAGITGYTLKPHTIRLC